MKSNLRVMLACAIAAVSGCSGSAVTDPVDINTSDGVLSIVPLTDNTVRIKVKGPQTLTLDEIFYTEAVKAPRFSVEETDADVTVRQKGIVTVYDKASESLSYYDAKGKLLFSEAKGTRKVEAAEISGKPMASVSQTFVQPQGEHLFGLGQFQDGYLDVSGLTRRLTQVNTQISIPVVISNKGYGLMWNNYGMVDFNPSTETVTLEEIIEDDAQGVVVNATSTHGNVRERRFFANFTAEIDVPQDGEYSLLLDVGQAMARRHWLSVDGNVLFDVNNTWLPPTSSVKTHLSAGKHVVEVHGSRGDAPTVGWRLADGTTEFSSPVAEGLDYTVFAGTADDVVSSFRNLTGKAPQIPDWALGYVHCRERYKSQEDVLENARTFVEKNIPVGVIVQDWQWWGNTGWNSMQFDPENYPEPGKMVDELHDMGMRFMLSVWSKVDRNSELGKELEARGYYIDGTDWLDFFDSDATSFYWKNFSDKLVSLGIDAWWFDATEPENDDLVGRTVGKDELPGEIFRNIYPIKVVNTMYNGLKQARNGEEPLILTRSAAPGMQKYGAVTWSGDVGNDWETLRRQIVGGLGMMCAGQPWWTYDAGGFFRPRDQYEDAAYQERMLRWIQTSVMLPVMRVHGYMSNTEPWRYSEETEKLFTKAISDRYDLLPYIKQCAKKVANENYTLMRPLVFDFPSDEQAMLQDTEYMFGPKYLVCPVIAENVTSMEVYLPQNAKGWTCVADGKKYDGGQYVTVSVSADAVPVFERK